MIGGDSSENRNLLDILMLGAPPPFCKDRLADFWDGIDQKADGTANIGIRYFPALAHNNAMERASG